VRSRKPQFETTCRVDNQQQIALQKRLQVLLEELDKEISDADEIYGGELSEFEIPTDEKDSADVKNWKKLETLIVKRAILKERVATLVLLQTQIRLFSIELKPLNLEEETAIEIAIQRRLDLMNSKAAVTDAFRGVEIAADQLESDLSVTASAELGTDNDKTFERFEKDIQPATPPQPAGEQSRQSAFGDVERPSPVEQHCWIALSIRGNWNLKVPSKVTARSTTTKTNLSS